MTKEFKFENVPVDKITTGFFQVAIKNAGAKIDELEAGIKAQGLLQPIGVARSKITEDSPDFDWEVLWGQRRVAVFKRLKRKEIPAMVLDEVLTKEEGMTYALMENVARREMNRTDIFNAIKLIWVQFGDEKKCADVTGIPLPLVKDALKAQRIDRLKGGREVYDHTTETCSLPTSIAHKVLDAVMKPDNVSVDKKKGKKLADVLAVQDVQMRNKVLKAALNTPEGDVDGWVADAKNMRSYIKKTIELVDMENEALKEYANSLGMDDVDVIKELVITKLQEDGFI